MLLDISFQSSTNTDAVSRSCFVKKGFLEILQNWQEVWGLKLY